MSNNKLFIWDFHGVLEKDNEKAVVEISNKILAEEGYTERFTEQDNERLYGLKWYQYFERLSPRFSNQECLDLQAECFKLTENDPSILLKNIKTNDNVIEVLTKIDESDGQQIVVSNTRQQDLIWFLNAINAKQFFYGENIIGVNAHQTHETKLYAVQDYLKDKTFSQIIVIGDSESDLELGRAIGATTYFYKHPGKTTRINSKR